MDYFEVDQSAAFILMMNIIIQIQIYIIHQIIIISHHRQMYEFQLKLWIQRKKKNDG